MTVKKQKKTGRNQNATIIPGTESAERVSISVPSSYGSGTIRVFPFSNGLELVLADCTPLDDFVLTEHLPDIFYVMIFQEVKGSLTRGVPDKRAGAGSRFDPPERSSDTLSPNQICIFRGGNAGREADSCLFYAGGHVRGLFLVINQPLYEKDLERRLRMDCSGKLDQLFLLDSIKVFSSVSCIFREMFDFSGNEISEGLFFQSKAEELVAVLLAHETEIDLLRRNPAVVPDRNADEIGQVISYLRSHRNEKCNLDQLAHKFCMSTSTLTASFRRNTGMSVASYRKMLRAEEARRLLSRTSLSQEEIAARLGFRSVSNFSDFFRRECSCSPGEWRRKGTISGADSDAARS